MEKIGSNIKIDLINAHGIHEALTNDFKNEMALKLAIYNCPKNVGKLENVLKNHDQFGGKWKITYEDENLMIFEHKDGWGNLNYLHIRFN